jgi:hypothetical protein
MSQRWIEKLAFLAMLWLGAAILVSPVMGQGTSTVHGAISGYIHEAGNANAPVPKARIRIVELESGFEFVTIADGKGEYLLPNLRPGVYQITAEAPNYRQISPQDKEYQAGERSEITGFAVFATRVSPVKPPPLSLMKLAATAPGTPPGTTLPGTTPVAGTGAGQSAASTPDSSLQRLVSLGDASRSANFDTRVLLGLPLAGNRSFDQLALLAPGVAPPPQAIGNTTGPGVGAGVGTSGQFAVNGLRSRANNFTVDGSDNNDEDIGVRRQGFTALVPQAVESVQNFNIFTALPTSQYGRNLGAQVNAVSRGGTQQFHGSLYGFYTDRRLKARDAFDQTGGADDVLRRANGQPVVFDPDGARTTFPLPDPLAGENPFTRGQYGFTLSGPVTKRNTLFFASFERQDVNATRESHFSVPTVGERGLFGSGETGLTVRTANNQTRQAFPTSAVGDYYFSLLPFANNPGGPFGRNTYTEQLPASADGTIFSLKLEQPFMAYTKQHLLTGRYNFTGDATTLPVTGEAIYSSLRAKVRTQNLSLFLISTFSPVLSNEARFSYGRTRLRFDEVRNPRLLPSRALPNTPFLLNARCFSNATFPTDGQTSYVPSCFTSETEAFTGAIGQVIVSGFSPVGTDVFNFPQRRVNNTFQFADSLTYTRTIHRVQAGVDTRHTQLNSELDRNFRSVAYFNGSLDVSRFFGDRQPFTPDRDYFLGADLVALGAASGFFQTFSFTNDSAIGLRYWQNNFFLLDQISLKPNFKLTLGLRYEVNTVPRESNRRIERTFTSEEVRGFIAEEKKIGASGLERYLAGRNGIFEGDHNNFAPHFAFAWDPWRDGKTVLRGGYGIYFDQIPGAVISQSRNVFPSFLTINLAGAIGGSGTAGAFNPSLLSVPGTLNTLNRNLELFRGKNLVEIVLALANLRDPSLGAFYPAAPNFVLPVADLRTPSSQHWSLALERELLPNLLVSMAYVGTKGTNLLRLGTPNLGPNAIPVIDGRILQGDQIVARGFAASPSQKLSFQRQFPLLGSFTSIESDANSIYHSLQTEASLRLTRGVQFTSAYTWSHAIDEVSDLFPLAGARGLPQNSFNRRAERGDANFDVRHRFAQSFIWDLPFFRQVDPMQRNLLGGWQLAGIATLQTGQPFTVVSGIDVNLDGNLTDRLNTINGIREVNEGAVRYDFSLPAQMPAALNAQRALLAAAGQDGAVGRNTFRAPGIAVFDLALNKNFRFTESQNLEFRTEIFNLFNRTHFGIPIHTLFGPGLGRSVNTTVPARTVQFGIRYKF